MSYANGHRPWQLYREVFESLYARCMEAAKIKGEKKFSLPGKLLSMDSTMISVCASVFDWAHYTRRKGAVKLHLLLDHDGYLPLQVLRDSAVPPGSAIGKDQVIVAPSQKRSGPEAQFRCWPSSEGRPPAKV